MCVRSCAGLGGSGAFGDVSRRALVRNVDPEPDLER